MATGPHIGASIHAVIAEAVAASEEQLAATRREAFLELDQLRRAAVEQARERVHDGDAAAEAMLRSAERAADELRASIGAAVEETRQQIDLLDEQVGVFDTAASSLARQLARGRERLDEVAAGLRRVVPSRAGGPFVAETGEEESGQVPAPEEVAASEGRVKPLHDPGTPTREPPPMLLTRPATTWGYGANDNPPADVPPAPAFKTQRRLAFSAAETRLAAAALTSAAVDKLDAIEGLLSSPSFSAEERPLSLMVLIREAEQLCRMAAQFGRPPLELTERLLQVRRRAARVLHDDD